MGDSASATPTVVHTFWQRHWQKLVAALIWLVLVGGFFGYRSFHQRTTTETLADVLDLLRTPIGPLFYILIYTLRPLAFFSAVVVTLIGGAIWGPIWGTLFVVIGSNLSASLAYGFGRVFGTGILDGQNQAGVIGQYSQRLRHNAFQTVLLMRLIYLPYDLVNYLSGLLQVPFRPFLLATIIGSLPGTLTFVLAGASLNLADILAGRFQISAINPWTLLLSAGLFIAGLVVSRWLRQRTQELSHG